MVTFHDEKVTVQDKKTREMAFICEKESDGVLYLRGTREGDHKDALASFLVTKETEEWKDLKEEVL